VNVNPAWTFGYAGWLFLIYLVPLLLWDEITNVPLFVNNLFFYFSCLLMTAIWKWMNDRGLVGLLSGEYRLARMSDELESKNIALASEQQKSEALLLNVLPAPIALRLKNGESQLADAYDSVTVLFADLVGFTQLSARTEARRLVAILNHIVTSFDDLADELGVEKVKTIGDSYMAVCGAPRANPRHAEVMAEMARRMLEALAVVNVYQHTALEIRIGLHSGPVVAGVIGTRKFAYDLWGDTVNTASRMESYGVAGRIHLSEATARLLDGSFPLESRGELQIRGKGPMHCYFLGN
jgi:adenylate cyclase